MLEKSFSCLLCIFFSLKDAGESDKGNQGTKHLYPGAPRNLTLSLT